MYNKMKECSKCKVNKPLTEYQYIKSRDYYVAGCRECHKKAIKANRPKYKEYDKEYAKKNWLKKKLDPEYQLKHREYQREYKRKRRLNPHFRMVESLRSYFYGVVIKKENSIFKYLGISADEFRQYLESQFDDNMSWDNYGSYWEIDHIKEIENFDLSKTEHILECWNYKNLRPLSVEKNRTRRYGR
tara:strand:+ start:75 stop:635 length:561 start_codon:yes stop_codon:yes gene_type:complete